MAKSKWPGVKEKLVLVEAWARDGLTEEDIYKRLKISKQTFYTYKKNHVDLFDALKEGKEPVDVSVENALLKRARGYSYNETTNEITRGPNGTTTKMRTISKEVPPDVAAAFIWLKNRVPDKWCDNPHLRGNVEDEDDNLFKALAEAVKPK